MELKCIKCGKVSETIPLHCQDSMIYNEKNHTYECYMGPECGFISIDEYVCENCCK